MNKSVFCFIVLFVSGTLALAHEFWLYPQKFRVKAGEELMVVLLAGENFDGEPWDLKTNRIEKLDLHQLEKVTNLEKSIQLAESEKIKVKLVTEGTYLIALQSKNKILESTAEEFNAYLKEDGLDNVYDHRTKSNTLDKPAKEIYSRFAKVLIQSGTKTDDTFKKKSGLRLEIIPDQNPYSLKTGDYLQCTVLFEGKPVTHQLVKVWNKISGRTFMQNIYTEKDGTIKFPINSKGPWMVSTVKMIPSETADADWRSMWSSLTFGIE
jgi:Nickel uptake substrate-specific transmembrane region.